MSPINRADPAMKSSVLEGPPDIRGASRQFRRPPFKRQTFSPPEHNRLPFLSTERGQPVMATVLGLIPTAATGQTTQQSSDKSGPKPKYMTVVVGLERHSASPDKIFSEGCLRPQSGQFVLYPTFKNAPRSVHEKRMKSIKDRLNSDLGHEPFPIDKAAVDGNSTSMASRARWTATRSMTRCSASVAGAEAAKIRDPTSNAGMPWRKCAGRERRRTKPLCSAKNGPGR